MLLWSVRGVQGYNFKCLRVFSQVEMTERVCDLELPGISKISSPSYSSSSSQSSRSKIFGVIVVTRNDPRGGVEGGGTVRLSESNVGSLRRSSLSLGK